ncbi:MAG: PKD domain protein [Methanocella sp. PtaU1.Bin125]|nr:MAG: PKD domain protein [Methanocella sp. PtaU1.Bin125]
MKTVSIFLLALAAIAVVATGATARGWPGQLSADFMADVNTGAAPLTVQFTDTSEGSPSGWEWDFGDGSYSTLQDPVYTYNRPGTYTVTLNVTDGTQTATKSGRIVVTPPMVTTPRPTPVRVVQPILVPIKDPRHERPPHHDQPPAKKQPVYKYRPVNKDPVKKPIKSPEKAP